MFDTYADIFNKRGVAYHQAMHRYPTARDDEFGALLQVIEPVDGHVIADMPSGGGYLRRYLSGDRDVRLIAIETTQAFYEQCVEDENTTCLLRDLDQTGLASESVDTVVSMAGLHHVDDRPTVLREMHRILRPGGCLCVADVESGSAIDGFLNTFVDQHNSMGHDGHFIDDTVRDDLRRAAFTIELDVRKEYGWAFEGVEQMVDCCTLMFGLDQASPEEVLEGIAAHQGYREGAGCVMNWGLRFIRCVKEGVAN
jgi:SAM-dependent methyltransferase